MKKIYIVLIIVAVFILGIFTFLYFAFIAMEIEDKYGDFQDLYYQGSDGNLVIIDKNEYGFIKKYDRDIFIEQGDCLKNILTFSKNNIEVYEVDINETYVNFSFEEAKKIKNQSSTKLVYKNF